MTTLLPRTEETEEKVAERFCDATLETRGISYDRHGFCINGRRRILLAGTIAYFRMVRGDWRDRLTSLRQCGFNTVDVYVPWNFHEPTEGAFDFTSGNHDLAAYLTLCQELGLFVYFRPGPYICNEWDGGALPAWLYTKPEVRLRQNEPNYLGYVRRYLHHINEIVRPFLHTNGGPVILYALENELDFFPCEDPVGYMTALRDIVQGDRIDVPLTACIGNRTPVREATGLVDDVLPSPNIYYNGNLEKEATRALTVLQGERFQSGASMRNVPPIVTEMHRDENSLRRILAAGFKGLGPFNFAGGTNFGRWQAVNNWGGLSYLTTSIDFGGMIGFDGRVGKVFADARRLAGLVNAFEEEIALGEPVTSWESGSPTGDNPLLGAREDEGRPGRIYSLIRGERGAGGAFVFLYNGSDAPQTTHVSVGALTFPCHSTLEVTPDYDHIALANLPLDRFGIPATLRYSTAEVAELTYTSAGEVRLVLCGPTGATGELRLEAETIQLAGPIPDGCFPEEGVLTLVFRFAPETFETIITVGPQGERLRLVVMERSAAGWQGLAKEPEATPSYDLLAAPRTEALLPGPIGVPMEGDLLPLEPLGVLQGAGWYEIAFDVADASGGEIVLSHAGDLLTVSLDDEYIGTYLGDGGPLTIALTDLKPGSHTLNVRAEIWGHANFHDSRWPSAHLGSLRGVWGVPTLAGEPLANRTWRFAAEPDVIDYPAGWENVQGGAVMVPGGTARLLHLALAQDPSPHGAVLTLEGTDCHGEIWLGRVLVGRFVFGPNPPVAMTGGPGDRFFLPADLLRDGDAPLLLLVRGAGIEGGQVIRATVERIPIPGRA